VLGNIGELFPNLVMCMHAMSPPGTFFGAKGDIQRHTRAMNTEPNLAQASKVVKSFV
jgi:hypothetical protein